MIVAEPDPPWIVPIPPELEREKSKAAALTVNVNVVAEEVPPPVPVTVTVYEPGVVEGFDVFTVRVLVAPPMIGVTDDGLKEQEAPVGRSEHERLTI